MIEKIQKFSFILEHKQVKNLMFKIILSFVCEIIKIFITYYSFSKGISIF